MDLQHTKNRIAVWMGLALGLASGGLNLVAQNQAGGLILQGRVAAPLVDPFALSHQTPQVLQTLHNGYLIAGAALRQELYVPQETQFIVPEATAFLKASQYEFHSQDAALMNSGLHLASSAELAWVRDPAHSDAPWNVMLSSKPNEVEMRDAGLLRIEQQNAIAGY